MSDVHEENRQYDTNRIEYALALGLLDGVKTAARALDAGAGKGEFADMLSARGYRVSCVEGAPHLAEELAARGYDTARADLEEERLPFEDDSFDLAVSLEVIEHLWNTGHYLSELQRVLKPGGYAVFTTPNYNYWSFRVRALLGQAERFLTQDYHKKLFTAHSLEPALSPYFEVEETAGRGKLPKARVYYPAPALKNLLAMHIGVRTRVKK